jgi:hypothetical protein
LHLQSRLCMPGINADDGQSHLIELGPQPRRSCSRLEADTYDMRRMQFDKCCDCAGPFSPVARLTEL